MVEVSNDGLLPCPFCGGEAQIRGSTETAIICTNDQCIIDPRPYNNYGHRDHAILAWNERLGTEGLCDTLATLQAERDSYRVALETILSGDVPRRGVMHWREDGQPSKMDQCVHHVTMRDLCPTCTDAFITTALSDTPTVQS